MKPFFLKKVLESYYHQILAANKVQSSISLESKGKTFDFRKTFEGKMMQHFWINGGSKIEGMIGFSTIICSILHTNLRGGCPLLLSFSREEGCLQRHGTTPANVCYDKGDYQENSLALGHPLWKERPLGFAIFLQSFN